MIKNINTNTNVHVGEQKTGRSGMMICKCTFTPPLEGRVHSPLIVLVDIVLSNMLVNGVRYGCI